MLTKGVSSSGVGQHGVHSVHSANMSSQTLNSMTNYSEGEAIYVMGQICEQRGGDG